MRKEGRNTAGDDLEQEKETTTGAFIPVNNDDDDYDAERTPDKDQHGAIAGETDLLPIVIRGVKNPVGSWELRPRGDESVRIWQKRDRTVAGGFVKANADDITMYVEGVKPGVSEIDLYWTKGPRDSKRHGTIKVTVFDWSGPPNVPGRSVHRYTVMAGASASLPEGVKWVDGAGGAVVPGGSKTDAKYKWDPGPVTGAAAFKVNDDYTWGLDVNVVEVRVEAPEGKDGKAFEPGPVSDKGVWTDRNGKELKLVKAESADTPAKDGLTWKAKVTLTGPSNNRGRDRDEGRLLPESDGNDPPWQVRRRH